MARVPDDPSKVSGPFQVEVRRSSDLSVALSPGELRAVGPDELRPVRDPRTSRESKNKTGLWFSPRMRRHVQYESLLERNRMLLFDFDPETKCYLEQPVKLKFRVETKERIHVPDLLVWRTSGPMVLCNVKPKDRLGEKSFPAQSQAAALFCQEEGIEYAVLSEPDSQTLENLRWLRGYFQVEYRDADDYAAISARLSNGPASIDELLEVTGPEILSKPIIFAALWWRAILCDLSSPLDRATVVWANRAD